MSYSGLVYNSITAESGFQYINGADVDGDGVDEIVTVNLAGTSVSNQTTTLKITIYRYDATISSVRTLRTFYAAVNGIVRDDDLVSPQYRCYELGDFRGDGKSQLLTISCNTDFLGTSRTSYTSIIDLNSGAEMSETNLLSLSTTDRLFCIDMDGDGRTELCHANPSGMKMHNLIGNIFSQTRTVSTPTSTTLSRGYQLTDLNADGYVDIAVEAKGNTTNWHFYKYNGVSFASSTVSITNIGNADNCLFFDVNKDGLADLVKRSGTVVYIYPNNKGTFNSADRITSSRSYNASTQLVPCNAGEYMAMSDFITVEGPYVKLYEFSQDLSRSRLLTEFTNSLGGVCLNNYASMSSGYAYQSDATRAYSSSGGYVKMNFPLQLLESTQSYLSSPLTLDSRLTDIGFIYYDACLSTRGLGFCGFGKVKTFDFHTADDEEIVTTQIRNPEKMGVTTRIEKSLRLSQSTPFDVTDYTYDSHTTTYGRLNPRLINIKHTDNLTTLRSNTSYTYDSFDYPAEILFQRRVGEGLINNELQTFTYSHLANLSFYSLGNVLSSTKRIIDAPSSNLRDNDSTIFRPRLIPGALEWPIGVERSSWSEQQLFTYNSSMLPLSRIDYVQSDLDLSPSKVLETRWNYDAFGNVLSERVAPYNVTSFTSESYTYDSTGELLLSATNALGQTKTFSEHNKFGKPTATTDHAGRVTTDVYDDWGNVLSRTSPDGTFSYTVYAWGGEGRYTVTSNQSGAPSTIAHYDATGRVVREGSQRFDGQWIFTDTEYGQNGLVQRVSLPFKSGDGSSASLWNEYEYDEYGRPVSLTEASGKVSTWEYADNTVTRTKNGVWSERTVNANGDFTQVRDEGGTVSYSYRLDAQPSIISVNGVATTFQYDKYGRRICTSDPSAGVQTDNTAYNSNGSSVHTHTNPNGSIVTYADPYGRVTRVERSGEYSTDYTYIADNLLLSETSTNGTSTLYSYDAYDRVATSTETVPDGKWLRRVYTYGPGGNVSTVAYESQSGVIGTETFTYSNGSPVAISFNGAFVRQITAENEFGQPTSVTTGGISRTYSYNAYGLPTLTSKSPTSHKASTDTPTPSITHWCMWTRMGNLYSPQR